MKWLAALPVLGLLFAHLDVSSATSDKKDKKDKKSKDKSIGKSGTGTGTEAGSGNGTAGAGTGRPWKVEDPKVKVDPPDQANSDDYVYWVVKLDHPAVTCGPFALNVTQMGWGVLDTGTPFAGAPFAWEDPLPPGFKDGATGTYRFAQATPEPNRHMLFAALANCMQDSNMDHNDGGDIYCRAAPVTYALIDDQFKGTGDFNQCKILG